MSSSKRYMPSNSRSFNKFIKLTYGNWLARVYRIEHQGFDVFRTLRPPYVVVANHVTTRDPFFLGASIPDPVYWVTGDGNLRTRFMRFFLSLVGSIPKAKAIPDIDTINWIVDVIRKRKGVVGLFPEGQQCWDGRTLPLFPSTAKLLKMLKVPVVAARIEGGYMSLPRWTWNRRKGRVRVVWSILFQGEELKTLKAEEVFARLEAGLAHDEYASLDLDPISYRSRRRAEHVELALFTCQDCGTIGRMRSRGNRLHCHACGSTWTLDRRGRFHALGKAGLRFDTIRDWDAWQGPVFADALEAGRRASFEGGAPRPFFSDEGAVILKGRKMNPLRRLRAGTLILYPDRLELATILGEVLVFPLAELEAITVMKRSQLEFYRNRDLYQVNFALRSVSARKWAVAMEYFKSALGAAPSKA